MLSRLVCILVLVCYVSLFLSISWVMDLFVDLYIVSIFLLLWNGCGNWLCVVSICVLGVLVVMIKLLFIDR